MDAFDALGLAPSFALDAATLEARHRALSATLHPDRYAGASASERRLALGRAIEVNDAWRLLRDPVRRAECLLVRGGVPVGETSEPKADPGLLFEMMEVREELATARRAKDRATLDALAARMRGRETAVLAALEEGFAGAGGDVERLRALLPRLGELRYLRRFFEELDAIEDELLG